MGVWSYDFVAVQTHGSQAPAHDVDRRVYSLSSVHKSHDPIRRRTPLVGRTGLGSLARCDGNPVQFAVSEFHAMPVSRA
jgi:hypothetical protein